MGVSPCVQAADPYEPEFTQGNDFIYRTSGSQAATTTRGVYIRFTATADASANSLSLYLSSATASSLTFGLQADNGSGAPSGTFLASGTITPTTGWNSITFADQSLVAGQVYHVVILPTSSGNASLRSLASFQDIPFASQTYGIKDNQYAFGFINNGTPAAANNETALPFVVGTKSSMGMGMAYYNTTSVTLSATTPYGQRFRFTSGGDQPAAVLNSITLRLSAGATDIHNVQVTLLDDANVILATTVLDASTITPGTTGNYTVNFENGPKLTDESYYRLALTVEGGGTNSVRWIADITGSTSNTINSATFQGLDGYVFSYSDNTFSTPQGSSLGNDFIFSYTATAVPEPRVALLLIVGFAFAHVIRKRA